MKLGVAIQGKAAYSWLWGGGGDGDVVMGSCISLREQCFQKRALRWDLMILRCFGMIFT